jgi:uncharacterized membrane protein
MNTALNTQSASAVVRDRGPVTTVAAHDLRATATSRATRIDAVDLLRGLIMAIMMLDHTRDFVHRDALSFDAADVERTFPMLFFTRWITHFCAPLFVFLAGTAVSFQEMRGKPKAQLSRFLVTRGLWLVAIELFVLRPLVFFNFHYGELLFMLQVIWAIGWSMFVLAAVIHLPRPWIIGLSVAVIALHNTLDGVRVTGFGASFWQVLHRQGPIFPLGPPGYTVFVMYPLVPWIAVMASGYAFGWLYRENERDRRRHLILLGSALVLGFIILRALNVYGDPVPWTTRFGGTKTILSFLALRKYPPSLLFLLMTLGPGILFLAFAERRARGGLARIFITYGRVPFFFYVLQWLTAHCLAIAASWLAGKPVAHLFSNFGLAGPLPPTDGIGFGLPMVYFLWLLGLVLLYPLCRWFADVKARRRDWWLSYL